MISAFGVDHGGISKGRLPLIPKVNRIPSEEMPAAGSWTHRHPSKLLKEKMTHKGTHDAVREVFPVKMVIGGGLTRAGKVTAGTAAVGGTGALVHREISKGRTPLIPKTRPWAHPDAPEQTWSRRGPSKLLKEKMSIRIKAENGIPTKSSVGGGLTRAGKVTAGTAAVGGAGGTGALVHHKRKK